MKNRFEEYVHICQKTEKLANMNIYILETGNCSKINMQNYQETKNLAKVNKVVAL